MKKYIWVGPRESDIESCSIKFDATITWYGDGKNNCSYLKKNLIIHLSQPSAKQP